MGTSDSSTLRRLAEVYALTRAGFGAASVAAPAAVFRRSLGSPAEKPGTQSIIRSFGIRDVVLGLTLLDAVRSGGDTRRWLTLSGLCGLVDAVAIAVARDDLPEHSGEMLALAGLDAVSGFGLAALTR
ncbi:MAG TPA: hypothetical protein VGW10_04170 [Solirubrobacteraceae bacterium]|nr:hypothetical protein [Solirubrobacteraceae bacterium]